MHSSRMRTRPLVDRMLESASRGGGGVWCRGGLVPGGVWCQEGPGLGGGISQHALRQTPPCGQTDACENITLAQLRCGR